MIKSGTHHISSIVVTSIMGHGGGGDIFPLKYLPTYREVAEKIQRTETTVIAKSATRFKRKGNFRKWAPWRCIKQIRDPRDPKGKNVIGLLNSFGLTNPGVEACAHMIKESIKKGFRVIPSYFPEFMREGKELPFEQVLKETLEALRIYREILGNLFWIIEINASCPNSGESLEDNMGKICELVRMVRLNFPDLKIIVKISPVHPVKLALELEKIGVDVIHALNTFPHGMLFPDKVSPLAHLGGGGYSGEMTSEWALEKNTELRRALKIPMIMGCGISSRADVREYEQMIEDVREDTQNSLAICSIIRTDPEVAMRILEDKAYYYY